MGPEADGGLEAEGVLGADGGPEAAGTTLSPVERAALAAVDLDRLLALLGELVAFRSLAGRESPAQRRVAEEMEDAGLSSDVWEIDFEALRRHPAYAVDVERDSGLGVVGSMGAGSGPTLALNAHVDVVPAGEAERWSHPPWRATVADGAVYGRGTADMKGALCCALAAARAIRDAGVELQGRLRLQSVIGEEDGGAGTLATLLRGHGADAAVVLEPTRLAVAPAQAGALNFRVTVPGRAAHGCFREEGVSPVEKFFPVYEALMRLEARRNAAVDDPLFADYELPFALCVGRVRSGVWASTVAESLVFEGRYGIAPGEDPGAAVDAFEAAVEEAASADPWLREHPPRVEWPGARFAAARTPPGHPAVRSLRAAFRAATGVEPAVRGMTYGADMGLLAGVGGIPTVLFGPGDVRDAHRPDEHVRVADLEACVRTLVVLALRFCGVGEAGSGRDEAGPVPRPPGREAP